MAPIRRYLRISAYSVLEVRIYLDNPADAHRWLLQSSDPALPRIIQAVRPFVLPKLREENERQKKGSKKKGVKDVVHGEDFEVSIFLTELSTPHAILTRAKVFGDNTKEGQEGSKSMPVEVGDDGAEAVPGLRTEDSGDADALNIADIPMAGAGDPVEASEAESEAAFQTQGRSRLTRGRRQSGKEVMKKAEEDDKKKLGFKTSYEGFRIHGRILCLVVKRKSTKRGQVSADSTGQAMLENWIASTQENTAVLDD